MDLGWGFHYPVQLVKKGLIDWWNNDFKTMPDPHELMQRDPLWEQDLQVLRQIVEHKRPKDKK